MRPTMALESPRSQSWGELCLTAVRTTTECADWCIQNVDDPECIRFCLDAGDLATAAARLISRESPYAGKTLEATADVLERCARSCGEHRGEHDVFGRCADACTEAAQACKTVAQKQA